MTELLTNVSKTQSDDEYLRVTVKVANNGCPNCDRLQL